MPTAIETGSRVVFIGDSITDCGHAESENALGNGYVSLFAALLAIREPQKRIHWVNNGNSGDTVVDLAARWQADAISCAPDWLIVQVGINDLHSHVRGNRNSVAPARFRDTYRTLLQAQRHELPACRLVLIEPFYICLPEQAKAEQVAISKGLPAYGKSVRDLAAEHQTRLVRAQSLFLDLLALHPASGFCPEPVHPNLTGHLALAEALYAAC